MDLRVRKLSIAVAAAVLGGIFFPAVSDASSITYNVNISFVSNNNFGNPNGVTATVVGTITTDGTIGALLSTDITTYSLTLNDGVNPTQTIAPDGSGDFFSEDSTNELTATATGLFFNFSGNGDADFGVHQGFGLGLEGSLGGDIVGACATGAGCETVRTTGISNAAWSSVIASGSAEIAVAPAGSPGGGTATAPEPSSVLLLGSGLLVALRGRKMVGRKTAR